VLPDRLETHLGHIADNPTLNSGAAILIEHLCLAVRPATYPTASVTVPAPNANVQGANSWLIPNHSITIEGAGIYKVESIDPNDEHKASRSFEGARAAPPCPSCR
jgi:hypothetical protein